MYLKLQIQNDRQNDPIKMTMIRLQTISIWIYLQNDKITNRKKYDAGYFCCCKK